MKMMKYSIFSAPVASIGGAEGAPKGRHRLHWSAGGETHVARPARCLREERGRCGPYDLRNENTISEPTFQQKSRNLEAHFSLKTVIGRFLLTLWCSFLLRWRFRAQNFEIPPQFFAERRFPHPNGEKMLVG